MKINLLVLPLILFSLATALFAKTNLPHQASDLTSGGAKYSYILLEEATVTPSPPPTHVEEADPTKILKPTSTPVPLPSPPSQGSTNILIFFGALAIVIVIFGVLINRSKIK